MKTPISAYTCIGFLVNRVIEAAPDPDLTHQEIFDAARDGRLIDLLVERHGNTTDFTWLTEGCAVHLEQMEAALCDAASGYDGRVGRPTGPVSGLLLVMTILLEAIQREFHSSDACEPTPETA